MNQQQYKDIEELQEKIRNLEADLKAEKDKKQPDRQPENQTPQATQEPQELKTAYPSVEECLKNPQVNKMTKTLMAVAEELEVPKNEKGHVELPKIVDAAKAMKAENSRLKTLITKATQAIKAKLKKPLITFTEGLKELLTWQQPHPEQNPEPDRKPEDHAQHLKNTLSSFRNEISDLYRSKPDSENPDRQKPGQSEQSKKPKKSRGFER